MNFFKNPSKATAAFLGFKKDKQPPFMKTTHDPNLEAHRAIDKEIATLSDSLKSLNSEIARLESTISHNKIQTTRSDNNAKAYKDHREVLAASSLAFTPLAERSNISPDMLNQEVIDFYKNLQINSDTEESAINNFIVMRTLLESEMPENIKNYKNTLIKNIINTEEFAKTVDSDVVIDSESDETLAEYIFSKCNDDIIEDFIRIIETKMDQQIHNSNIAQSHFETNIQENDNIAKNINEDLLSTHKFIVSKIINEMDPQKLAFFLSELSVVIPLSFSGIEEFITFVDIKDHINDKVDFEYLASLALVNQDYDLLGFAMSQNPDIASYSSGGKSLLQIIIGTGVFEEVLEEVLSSIENLNVPILLGIAQNDLDSLSVIFSTKPELLQHKIFGYTPLHITLISGNSSEKIIPLMLNIDSKSANILTDNGETALELSSKYSSHDITDFLFKVTSFNNALSNVEIEQSQKVIHMANEFLFGQEINDANLIGELEEKGDF